MSALQQPLRIPIDKRNFAKPDETRQFELGKVDIVNIGGVTFGRATFQPGWRWSTCIGSLTNTKICDLAHVVFQISGRLHVAMQDGTEVEYGPGDLASIPPGHDAWVVGNEPVIAIDVAGMKDYAKR